MALLLSSGCARQQQRVQAPDIDPWAAGRAAMKAYDTDGDGRIGGKELAKIPSLQSALAHVDTSNDGMVSIEELATRIVSWQQSRIGVLSVSCSVTIDDTPVNGAHVRFIPEEFLGNAIMTCSGKSTARGDVMLAIDDPLLKTRGINGAHCGFYKVVITGSAIPSKYVTTDTPLGVEVAPDAEWLKSGLRFLLRSP